MAEGYLRHLLKQEGLGDVEVTSAGVGAMAGQSPSKHAVEALADWGIDITDQRSQMISNSDIEETNWIFGMTQGHVDMINSMFPEAASKTFLIRRFVDHLSNYDKEVSDPIGGSLQIYQACRDEIKQGIDHILVNILSELKSQPCSSGDTNPKMTIAIASDHAGFAAKEAVKLILESHSYKIDDFGTRNENSTDYPDYAKSVAEHVAEEKADIGVLICSTGIGMSIAANKVSGIRAALVNDLETARLSREHNHANVICMGAKGKNPEILLSWTHITHNFWHYSIL